MKKKLSNIHVNKNGQIEEKIKVTNFGSFFFSFEKGVLFFVSFMNFNIYGRSEKCRQMECIRRDLMGLNFKFMAWEWEFFKTKNRCV